MKLSIVIPVYYNDKNLIPLYEDLKEKVLDVIDYDYEIIMVNDGSKDTSYQVMQTLKKLDSNIKIFSLSRNFGSHAAVLCGIEKSEGDCIIIKAADLQEPSELILDMADEWKKGYNVVLAVRKDREEGLKQVFFANTYYWLVRKFALSNMPKNGFDIFLIDKKVATVLSNLDERNSSITAQILWSGFRTSEVPYVRKERTVGQSKWTLKKKIRLVSDTLFSFSNTPIVFITSVGICSIFFAAILAVIFCIQGFLGGMYNITLAVLIVGLLLVLGIVSCFIAILGEYMWRTLDASRNRPVYIVEEEEENDEDTTKQIR